MAAAFSITYPHDGDILTRHDGEESPNQLQVTVKGACPSDAQVWVNGHEAMVCDETYTCTIPLDCRRNTITAEIPGQRATIEVWWNQGSQKRFRFSVDDNIQFLKDLALAPDAYPSLFDHSYLGFWREMHQTFGTKVHLNIYYQTDGFDLTQMPDRWKEEWQANADWLHLSFHALQDKPDRPYRNARYPQIAHDYDLVCGHIRRFAGNEVLSTTTTVHWAECPMDGVRALHDRGIEQLISLFSVQGYTGPCTTAYYLSEAQCNHGNTRSAWRDRETGIPFIRCTAVINALEVEAIPAYLDQQTNTPHTAEMVELLIHEQYFRSELDLYQPTVLEKVKTALRWVTECGYQPVFWSDGFLGTPEK